jgi:hypothetical protein
LKFDWVSCSGGEGRTERAVKLEIRKKRTKTPTVGEPFVTWSEIQQKVRLFLCSGGAFSGDFHMYVNE